MTIEYRIDSDLGATFVAWFDRVDREEFLAHIHRLLRDPEWPPLRGLHLCDLRAAELAESIDRATLEGAADLYGSHPQIATLRVAIVAGEAFEQAALFERFMSQYRAATIAFNTLETACTWLGIDPVQAASAFEALSTRAQD